MIPLAEGDCDAVLATTADYDIDDAGRQLRWRVAVDGRVQCGPAELRVGVARRTYGAAVMGIPEKNRTEVITVILCKPIPV